MARPTEETNNNFSYSFPIPGLSHLHDGSSDIITVNKSSRFGYYWQVGASWPTHLQSFTFIDPGSLATNHK